MCDVGVVATALTHHPVTAAHYHSDDTDTGYDQSEPSRTHEKADMLVVWAAYPGELCNSQNGHQSQH